MSTVYEVTVTVAERLVETYERYMIDQHIPDVLATGYFVSAEMSRSEEKYRVRYYAESRERVDAYLTSDTDRLRADFVAHFPNGVTVTRDVWEVIASLPV